MPRAKGQRKHEILEALAQMLEAPKWERITTAALAARLSVSEAALYRHFASKAQMYEGLIEFIENSVFTLANKITQDEANGREQAGKLVEMLLAFAEKNPGMVRVLTGVIGAMQAMEAIKVLAKVGELLNGRLLIFDARSADWRSVRVSKDPACAVCGEA